MGRRRAGARRLGRHGTRVNRRDGFTLRPVFVRGSQGLRVQRWFGKIIPTDGERGSHGARGCSHIDGGARRGVVRRGLRARRARKFGLRASVWFWRRFVCQTTAVRRRPENRVAALRRLRLPRTRYSGRRLLQGRPRQARQGLCRRGVRPRRSERRRVCQARRKLRPRPQAEHGSETKWLPHRALLGRGVQDICGGIQHLELCRYLWRDGEIRDTAVRRDSTVHHERFIDEARGAVGHDDRTAARGLRRDRFRKVLGGRRLWDCCRVDARWFDSKGWFGI
mmetsp:Transcript_25288/g.70969  ORF Transcript_25288/g.70969 Transcript_25288/m.70969 type:complete len:280 (+) Transcript_25288:411-1250(+)